MLTMVTVPLISLSTINHYLTGLDMPLFPYFFPHYIFYLFPLWFWMRFCSLHFAAPFLRKSQEIMENWEGENRREGKSLKLAIPPCFSHQSLFTRRKNTVVVSTNLLGIWVGSPFRITKQDSYRIYFVFWYVSAS